MPTQSLSNGMTIAYDDVGPSDGNVVVLIHGLSGRRNTWDAVSAWIVERYPQLRVLSVDLRGHGGSSHGPAHEYTAIQFADDVAKLLHQLRVDRAAVVGHSLGGLVAQVLATDHHHVFRAAVLEDPPTFEGDEARRAGSPVASFFPVLIATMQRLRDEDAPVEAYRSAAQGFGPPGAVEDRMHTLYTWDHLTMQSALEGNLWAGFDPAKPIPVPVTVIRADPARNAVFLEADVEPFLTAQPHATVVMVEASEHMVHTEETFDAFTSHLGAAIDSFLADARKEDGA